MKKIFFSYRICFLLLFLPLIVPAKVFSQADTLHIIFDEPPKNELPRNFRMCNGGFIRERINSSEKLPDTTGLNGLNISGSSEFSAENLPLLIKKINHTHLIDFDLRQETHGFINGMCLSWYGKYDWADVGLSRAEVLVLEKHKLDSLRNSDEITVTKVLKKEKATDTYLAFRDSTFKRESVMSEEELTKTSGIDYFRITIADHRKPLLSNVDLFINIINSLSGIYWLHFHCHAGDGRTTTFMVMYDMMRSAKKVTFGDIIMRQHLIGGLDLTKDDDFPSWDKQYAIERTDFLKDFYEYCRSNDDNFKTSYSMWLRR